MNTVYGLAEAITMVLDVMRGYLQVAGGLTDVSVQRARHLADAMLSRSSDAAERSSEQISALAEDLVKQSQTNRDILIGLIRTEVDRAVGRMGFVREEELAAVRNHVQRLESQLKVLQTGATVAGTSAARSASGAAVRTISGAAEMAGKVVPGKRDASPSENVAAVVSEEAPKPVQEAASKRATPRKAAAPRKAATPSKAAAPRKAATPSKAAAPRKAAAKKTASAGGDV